MIKNISQLKVTVDNRDFLLLCDNDSPFPAVKEALFQLQKYVGQLEDAARKVQEEIKEKEENKCEAIECTAQE